MTDDIDELIKELRRGSHSMAAITLGGCRHLAICLDAADTIESQQAENAILKAEIDRQDAVIARLGEDKMFAIGYSCATELLTRIEYARANRKPESNDG